MADESLAEMYERQGWYLSPESAFYEGPYDTENMDHQAEAVAHAIYGPGVEWQEVNIPAEMVMTQVVSDREIPIVTSLDKTMTAGGILNFASDELWLPGEQQTLENWITGQVPTAEEAVDFVEAETGIAVPAVAMIALNALWPVLVAFIVGLLADKAMDWLGDVINRDGSPGGGGKAKVALYLKGKLVGYATEDVYRGLTGKHGLIAKTLNPGGQKYADIKKIDELPYGGD